MRAARVLQALTAITAVAVAVVGWRLVQVQSRVYPTDRASDVIVQPATLPGVVGHQLVPDLDEAIVVVPDRPHQPEETRDNRAVFSRRRSFPVTTNALGLRGPPVGPKVGFRVVVIGDSVPFGWGVPEHESLPACLARELGVEVVNAAIPAMAVESMASWADWVLERVPADLVVLVKRPGLSDVDRLAETVRHLQRRVAVAFAMSPLSTFDVRGHLQEAEVVGAVSAQLGDAPWLDLTPVLQEARRAPAGVRLVVDGVTQRVVDSGGATLLEVRGPTDRLAPEVTARFDADPGWVEPWFFDGGHPTAEGNEELARALARFLREEGLAPR